VVWCFTLCIAQGEDTSLTTSKQIGEIK